MNLLDQIFKEKLNWNQKSRIGSLEHAIRRPGGGDKKVERAVLSIEL